MREDFYKSSDIVSWIIIVQEYSNTEITKECNIRIKSIKPEQPNFLTK